MIYNLHAVSETYGIWSQMARSISEQLKFLYVLWHFTVLHGTCGSLALLENLPYSLP